MIIDPKKLKYQLYVINEWIAHKAKGWAVLCTGVGKTYIGVLAVKEMAKRHPDKDRTTLVIVPTERLKTQWLQHIIEHQLKRIKVEIINTAIKNTYNVDLLILDEGHRYPATHFKKIFNNVTYKFLLGLTATLERKDNEHEFLLEKAPIIARLSLKEAQNLGFISNYRIYNYGIDLDPASRKKYDFIDNKYQKNFNIFGNDFDLVKKCAWGYNYILNDNAISSIYEPPVYMPFQSEDIRKTRKDGKWVYIKYNAKGKPYVTIKFENVYGRLIGADPKNITGSAANVMKYIGLRKKFLYGYYGKLQAGLDIINTFNLPTITFSEEIEFIDRFTNLVNETTNLKAVSYHSKMSTKERELAIKKLLDNSVSIINSGKAIEEGFDVPGLEMSITFSGTSVQRQQIQRAGRVVRVKEGKLALIFNVYIKNTQDEAWVKGRTKGQQVYWIDSLDEINII